MALSFCNRKIEEFAIILRFQPLLFSFLCGLNFAFSLIATLGNLLVIQALWKASSIPANLKKMFLSLAFSDLALGLFGQLMFGVICATLLDTLAKGSHNFEFLCPSVVTVNMSFAYFLSVASFSTIAAISLDRFIAVTLHLRYHELITEKRVGIAIVIIWLTSGIASLALISISSHYYLITVVIQSVGLLAITVAYCRIYKVVLYHQHKIQTEHQVQNGQALEVVREKKSALNAFYVYLVTTACYLPTFFASIPLTVDNSKDTFLVSYYAATFLTSANSSLNPLVYCWRYREIRSIVKSTIKKLFRCS